MPVENKKSNLKSWKTDIIAAALLLLYANFFFYLYFSHKIIFFVHPDYALLGFLSAIFLLILALVNIVDLFTRTEVLCEDNCSAKTYLSKKQNVLFLLIPFLLAMLFPIKPLSSATAQLRSTGYNNDAGLGRTAQPADGFSIRSENRSLVDWIRLFSQDPEPDHYQGQKAKMTGFVLKDGALSEGYFLLSRFVISCCAADARPLSIPVRYNPQSFHFEENQWLEIEGKFDTAEIEGTRQPIILLESSKVVPIPENPYAE